MSRVNSISNTVLPSDYHLEGQKRHVSVENQSDEVDGLGSVSVWSGVMDIKEIG